MKVIKLTDRDGYTRRGADGETLWLVGTERSASGGELCSSGVIHAYKSREQAALMDPIHGDYGASALWWEAEADVYADDGVKLACTRLTVLRQIEPLRMTAAQRVRTAIYAVLAIPDRTIIPIWDAWAKAWVRGRMRSEAEAGWAALAAKAEAAWAEARTAWAADAVGERVARWRRAGVDSRARRGTVSRGYRVPSGR